MKVEHYLPLLLKRPGAFPYAKPVRHWQMPEIYREFLQALQASRNGDSSREFLLVLSLGRNYGHEKLEQAMSQALDEGKPGYERVRQIIAASQTGGGANQLYLDKVKVILPDTCQFDRLWRASDGEVEA
jgi:hypothetical protein